MQFGLFCIFIILCICSLLLGAEQIQWSTLFSFSHESWLTLTASRIPRLITIV
ncbi:ABC transporter permease, partial [Acinetobacter baumannii]